MSEVGAETQPEPRRPYAVIEDLTPDAAAKRRDERAQDLYDLGEGGTVRVYEFGDKPEDLAQLLGSKVIEPGRGLSILVDPEVVGPMIEHFRNRFKPTAAPEAQA